MRGFATTALICGVLNFVGYAAALAYVGIRYAFGF